MSGWLGKVIGKLKFLKLRRLLTCYIVKVCSPLLDFLLNHWGRALLFILKFCATFLS